MAIVQLLSLMLLATAVAAQKNLRCNEGFNASLGGIPLYHWDQNYCRPRSKCFTQELGVKISNLDVGIRYGGCVSKVYARYLTCENLFGDDSKFDPALLLNFVPSLEHKFTILIHSFVRNTVEEFHELFSSGVGSEQFISGFVKFMENIGFKMDKVKPLEAALTDLFELMFIGPFELPTSKIDKAINRMAAALKQLDTDNKVVSDNIYKFLSNVMNEREIQNVRDSEIYSNMIEKMPGLIKSILPDDWSPSLWYNVVFEILSEIDFEEPKQSVIDIIETIKYNAKIPSSADKYIDPVFDTLPDLVEQLVSENFSYAGYWSTELLKAYSITNKDTDTLKAALFRFIAGWGVRTLPSDVETLIEWLPGFFYQFFPASEGEISEVYIKMADGLNSFNFLDWKDTADDTELSRFIITLTNKITIQKLTPRDEAIVINFSKMFYNLLSDYTSDLDTFFTTLSNGFKNYPKYDVGLIITQLVTNLGGTVPPEVKPFLENLQGVVDSFVAVPFNRERFYDAIIKIITDYGTSYPDSEFPGLFRRAANLYKEAAMNLFMTPAQYQLLNDLHIDFYFALFNAIDFDTDYVFRALMDAFPLFRNYIRMMQTLDPDDVKELSHNFIHWISNHPTSEGFVVAMQPTMKKITAKLTSVIKDLRRLLRPNSCEATFCNENLCNNPVVQINYIKRLDVGVPFDKFF